MGNTNSTSDEFQGEEGSTKVAQQDQGKPVQPPVVSANDPRSDGALDRVNGGEEGSTKLVQPAQGKPVQQPVVLGNDPGSDGALDLVNGGKGDREVEEESQQVRDDIPTAESPETNPEFDDDETRRRPESNLQPGSLIEEPEQLKSDLVEQQEPLKQEEAEKLTLTSTAESPNPEADETRSKDSALQLHSLPGELEQQKLDLVAEQESFKQEAAEMLISTSTAETLETNPGFDETRSKNNNLQSDDLVEETEELSPDLAEGQEPCKQEEGEIPNPTTSTDVSSRDEDHMDSYELIESVPSQNEGNSSSTVLFPQHEEHLDSGEVDPKKDHSSSITTAVSSHDEEHLDSYELIESVSSQNEGNSSSTSLFPQHEEHLDSGDAEPKNCSSIITEPSSADITSLQNGKHLDDHTSHNLEGFLEPESIIKEELMANQPISPRSKIATEEDSEEVLANQHSDDHNSHNPEGVLVPENIIKEDLLVNQPVSPRAEIATEEDSEELLANQLSDDHTSHNPEGVLVPENIIMEELLANQPVSPRAEIATEEDSEELLANQHSDDHTSHNPEEVLVPENIIKEVLLANQLICPPAEVATEEESDFTVKNGNNENQESENGSQIDCSTVPENESNGSLNEPASEEEKMELPQSGITTTDSSNKEQDSEVIKQQREASGIENGGDETEGEEGCEPESPPEQEKAPAESGDSPQDSSSTSSWEFNPGNGPEFLADVAPTFVADPQEPVVPFPIQLPAKNGEADQQLGRLSTDSGPDNFSVNSKMQKSPSFNLHLRRRSITEDYSDQTPLLQHYQDKNTIIPPTKQTHTVESVKHEEAVHAEEKLVQTLERCDSETSLIVGRMKEGDCNGGPRKNSRASKEESAVLVPSKGKAQKQYSRRRPTIFCLCCRATTAIN
ncbi:unnamed protein product [Linum trigynum]